MNKLKIAVIVTLAFASLTSLAPAANASQSTKNNWRNLGIGAAAVGIYGATHHNSTLTGVGIAGAGYSAYRYEQDRKHQSQASSWRRYHRHRRHHH